MKKIYLFAVLALLSTGAVASDKVSSPNVTKDKFDIEYRGGYDSDHRRSKDHHQVHKLVTGYGVTDRIKLQLEMESSNDTDTDWDMNVLELAFKYQFFKPDEAWLSSMVELAYAKNTDGNDPDEASLKFLFQKEWEKKYIGTLNLSAVEEIGEFSENGRTYKAGLSTVYKVNDYFMPGFEYYANTGNLRNGNSYEEQRHSFGPVVHGKYGDIKYQVGYLFGISEAAQDERLKVIIGYETKF
jgi:hypothetical protein